MRHCQEQYAVHLLVKRVSCLLFQQGVCIGQRSTLILQQQSLSDKSTQTESHKDDRLVFSNAILLELVLQLSSNLSSVPIFQVESLNQSHCTFGLVA